MRRFVHCDLLVVLFPIDLFPPHTSALSLYRRSARVEVDIPKEKNLRKFRLSFLPHKTSSSIPMKFHFLLVRFPRAITSPTRTSSHHPMLFREHVARKRGKGVAMRTARPHITPRVPHLTRESKFYNERHFPARRTTGWEPENTSVGWVERRESEASGSQRTLASGA